MDDPFMTFANLDKTMLMIIFLEKKDVKRPLKKEVILWQ
jgi:hypothetical protein